MVTSSLNFGGVGGNDKSFSKISTKDTIDNNLQKGTFVPEKPRQNPTATDRSYRRGTVESIPLPRPTFPPIIKTQTMSRRPQQPPPKYLDNSISSNTVFPPPAKTSTFQQRAYLGARRQENKFESPTYLGAQGQDKFESPHRSSEQEKTHWTKL